MANLHNAIKVIVLVAILLADSSLGFDWWMEAPYTNDSFNVHAKYGENASVLCEDNQHHPDPDKIQYWLLPDMTVMNRSERREFQTFGGVAGWFISEDGTTMHVFMVQERHFGFYHCVSYSTTDGVYVVKKALNYKGPYFGDLWPQYKTSVIIGCSAAGGFFVLLTILCVVYECRHPDEDFEKIPAEDNNYKNNFDITDRSENGEIIIGKEVIIDLERVNKKSEGCEQVNFLNNIGYEHDNLAMVIDDSHGVDVDCNITYSDTMNAVTSL